MKTKCYRHGEITFKVIDKLPSDLTKSKTNIFMVGNTGNSHTFKGGKLYLKKVDDFVFGYFEAENTTLFHREHGKGKGKIKEAKLPNGFYELRIGNEIINKELKRVID
jgi:hypothetical protein